MENKKKLKIMVNTNAPWAPSGYGQQALQFLPRMVQEGYETACIAFYGLVGGIFKGEYMNDGVTYYPAMKHPWGGDAMVNHIKDFKPDIMFTLQDIWVVDPAVLKQLHDSGVKWVPIVPIDHEPVPEPILDRLKSAYRIVTYAPFGTRELKRQGTHSTYIPHTVPTEIFKKYDKKKVRKQIGIPEDHFVFGMVAANKDNPPRKAFQEAMEAFARFHKKHPKSALYMHTYVKTDAGFPIDIFAEKLGIQNALFHPDPYELSYLIDQKDMAKVYSCMDVKLLPSLNEGFGVPIIEALSCEVPVITNDFTAMKDLVIDGKTGYKTKVAYKRFDPLQSYIGVPDVEHLYELMEKMYEHHEKGELKQMGKNGREFVKEGFDIDVVWKKHWVPFLKKLEKEVHGEN